MCGIAGWLGHMDHPAPEELLGLMTDSLRHRGPDDDGYFLDRNAGVALGHRRLSIIDLTASGHQPMASPSGRYVITYNGEIYNYPEIRTQLMNKGHQFEGSSDTEVLLAACEEWGLESAVERAVGMFAFGLWDRDTQQLHLVRDRLGKKPMYFGRVGETLAFASELKALKHLPGWSGKLDLQALTAFFKWGYVPTPLSIYKDIEKLDPATIATISVNGRLAKRTYWDPNSIAAECRTSALTIEQSSQELKDVLTTSIRDRLISDVPLGAFLSGGIDSSTVVSLMQDISTRPVQTFTIGFSEAQYNEAPYAEAVAHHIGTNHTSLMLSPKDAMDVIPKLPSIFDEPFADSSAIPTFLVSQLARQRVTVALSGDGGDELFGGYNRHRIIKWVLAAQRSIPRGTRVGLARLVASLPSGSVERLGKLAAHVSRRKPIPELGSKLHKLSEVLLMDNSRDLYERLVSNFINPRDVVINPSAVTPMGDWTHLSDPIAEIMLRDLTTYMLDDILVKVDRASMAASLETRCPFLDHRVVEVALQLPTEFKVARGPNKPLLRQLLGNHVPLALFDRPKAGFAIPLGDWLNGPLREWANDLLHPDSIRSQGLLSSSTVKSIWQEHQDGSGSHQHRVWAILMFQSWLAESKPSLTH